MFERVVIRKRHADNTSRFDVGFLAEAMLFYEHVHVFANLSDLDALVAAFGPELLVQFLQETHFTMTYVPNLVATSAQANRYEFITITSRNHELQNAAPKLLIAATGKDGKGRRLARQLIGCVKQQPLPGIVLEHGRQDAVDRTYVQATASHVLREYAPQYLASTAVEFEVDRTQNGFSISSNIDFSSLSVSNPRVTPAFVLSHVIEARADIYFASEVAGEMALDAMRAAIVRAKLEAVARGQASESTLAKFNDEVLDGLPDVRAAINSGRKNFRDLLDLVRKAKRFREWVAGKAPDSDLATAYFREIAKDSWLDKLPPKWMRFAFFNLAVPAALDVVLPDKVANQMVGLAIGAADQFVMDKLARGWRPNQFIEGELKKFLAPPEGT